MPVLRILATTALVSLSLPAAARESAAHLYWSDTHLHTAPSFDAFAFGTFARLDLAYRCAKGMPVQHPVLGHTTRIDRPLDFMIIADHAEILGTVVLIVNGEAPEMPVSKTGQYVVETVGDGSPENPAAMYDGLNLVGSGLPLEAKLGEGLNPYKMGMAAGTDSHAGIGAARGRAAHLGPFLRRFRSGAAVRRGARPCSQRRAGGRRPVRRRRSPLLHHGSPERLHGCQPRPHPGHQGLAERRRHHLRESL